MGFCLAVSCRVRTACECQLFYKPYVLPMQTGIKAIGAYVEIASAIVQTATRS
jgi:hypothetical protein